MSVVGSILQAITPPQVLVPEEYDGLEYRWKMFVFRPAYLKTEVYLTAALLFYVTVWLAGKSLNRRKAERCFTTLEPVIEKQFSKPNYRGLLSDGYTDLFTFSTGRRNIASLHVVFTLRPIHDLFLFLFYTARTFIELDYKFRDDLELDFKLSSNALPHEFVWAVVAKNELRTVKDDRWDLTFTKTSENPTLPSHLSVMSEFADVTENIVRNSALVNVLKDPKVQPYFRSLSISDQPRDRPSTPISPEEREKHVILKLSIPASSRSDAIVPIVQEVFSFIDSLHSLNLRPETKTKLKKVREDLNKSLKADAEAKTKEAQEQARDDQKAAKRKAEEERIAKLPAAEQQKILEREKKRSIRKQQRTVRK
ncbi:hypothetical protein E1B28_004350 [Marasmius oreades]|uniref:DUF1682-domain-containing protein n=1 Tax=Marasmius oreades TaxID=181124 RepID=A0A9P7UYF1_9AGAR|nr:uncharacterized protein E1B28_004350 [Marasmius oreades]KAG7096953.1 hypothetical protein E1B28_004350 [Marasmius oreades]